MSNATHLWPREVPKQTSTDGSFIYYHQTSSISKYATRRSDKNGRE